MLTYQSQAEVSYVPCMLTFFIPKHLRISDDQITYVTEIQNQHITVSIYMGTASEMHARILFLQLSTCLSVLSVYIKTTPHDTRMYRNILYVYRTFLHSAVA